MIVDLDEVRDRAGKAARDIKGTSRKWDHHFPMRASALDVPALLELVGILAPLVERAHGFAENSEDTSALEALAEEAGKLSWDVLRTFGLVDYCGRAGTFWGWCEAKCLLPGEHEGFHRARFFWFNDDGGLEFPEEESDG